MNESLTHEGCNLSPTNRMGNKKKYIALLKKNGLITFKEINGNKDRNGSNYTTKK